MSIGSQVTRIKNNIENAYTACELKGATIPGVKNSENLSNCIATITASATEQKIEEGELFVRVIDYDGTVLKEAYLSKGDTFTLPQAPKHSKLVFNEWVSPVDIISNTVTVQEQPIVIGAQYETKSGLTEVDVEITPSTNKTVYFNMNGEKDWGDGTIDSETSHTYENYGEYEITCNGTTTSSYMFVKSSSSNDHDYNVKSVRFANVTSMQSSCLRGCYALRNVSFNRLLETMSYEVVSYNPCIKGFVIPKNCTTSTYFCNNCSKLENIAYSKNFLNPITTSASYFLTYCPNLKYVYIPPDYNKSTTCSIGFLRDSKVFEYLFISEYFTSISTNTSGIFNSDNYSLKAIDISEHNKIISLSRTDNCKKCCKIYTKPRMAQQYCSATNWTTMKKNITFRQFTVNCNVTGTDIQSIKIGNKELVNGENIITGYDLPPFEENNIIIKVQNKPDYIQKFNFEDISEDDVYNLEVDIGSLDVVTLTLNNQSTENAEYSYSINGVASEINTNSITCYSGDVIQYSIENIEEEYLPIIDTITITEDTTLNITMTKGEFTTWTRPTLSSASDNGILGGDKFAFFVHGVGSALDSSISTSDYRLVDGLTSNYNSYSSEIEVIYYTPELVKFSQIILNGQSSSFLPRVCTIYGSNNGIKWTEVLPEYSFTSSSTTYTITVEADIGFKYHKIIFKNTYTSNMWLKEIQPIGQKFVEITQE